MPKQRRHRLQIYREILSAIQVELMNEGNARPTRVQHLSNMSYDRLKKYVLELEKSRLIRINDGNLILTDKGHEFLKNYEQLTSVMDIVGLD